MAVHPTPQGAERATAPALTPAQADELGRLLARLVRDAWLRQHAERDARGRSAA